MNSELSDSQSVQSLKPNPNVLFRRLGDEIILFHLETDRFYELNGTAARFWELIAAGHNSASVRQEMMKEFAVEASEFDAEAEMFLGSLQKEDLVIGA